MSLRVSQLCKDYPTRSGPLAVLRGVDFELPQGEALAVMGPSGSGKSTLLHILGTLDRPTSGNVSLDGKDPFQLSEPDLAGFRNRNVGFIFQDHYLLPQRSRTCWCPHWLARTAIWTTLSAQKNFSNESA